MTVTLKGQRPWWAVAMMGGFGAVLAVLLGLGLIGHPAKADSEDRLQRIEARLNEIERSMGRIEGKLGINK